MFCHYFSLQCFYQMFDLRHTRKDFFAICYLTDVTFGVTQLLLRQVLYGLSNLLPPNNLQHFGTQDTEVMASEKG